MLPKLDVVRTCTDCNSFDFLFTANFIDKEKPHDLFVSNWQLELNTLAIFCLNEQSDIRLMIFIDNSFSPKEILPAPLFNNGRGANHWKIIAQNIVIAWRKADEKSKITVAFENTFFLAITAAISIFWAIAFSKIIAEKKLIAAAITLEWSAP